MYLKKIILFIVVLLLSTVLNAQTKIIGSVMNKKSQVATANATICLNNKYYTTTNKCGRFEFAKIRGDSIHIKITHIGFKKYLKQFKIDASKKKNYLPTIKLETDIVELGEVKVKGKGVLQTIKGDTTEYNVRLLKMDKYDTAKELVEALPGVYRDKNGNLIARGKKVHIVTIDGKHLYKGKVNANLEALPADVIAKVQIYDDYSELSKFCGFVLDESSSSSINLVTKYPNLKLALGTYSAGAGTKNRYILKGTNTFLLKDSNFNIKEYLANIPKTITKITSIRFPQKYKTKAIQAGINTKKELLTYYIDGDINDLSDENNVSRTTIYNNEARESFSNTKTNSNSTQAKLNAGFDYVFNKKNKLYLSNKFKHNDRKSDSESKNVQHVNSEEISNVENKIKSIRDNKSLINELISRSLLTPNTYLQLLFKSDYSEFNTQSVSNGKINNETFNNSQNKQEIKHHLLFNPKFIYRKNRDRIITIDHALAFQKNEYKDDLQNYNLKYLVNTFKVKSKFRGEKYNVSFDLGFRNVGTVNSNNKVNYNDFVGSIEFSKDIKKYYLSLNYTRSTQTPTIYQLYNFYDINCPLIYKLGNRDLKQAKINKFRLEFNKRNKQFIIYNIHYSFIENYITHKTYFTDNGEYMGNTYNKGTRINQFQNINGYWSLGISGVTQTAFRVMPNYTYTIIPNFYNGQKNISKSNKFGLTLSRSYYRNKFFTLNVYSNNRYNIIENSTVNRQIKNFNSNNSISLTIKNIWKLRLKIDYRNIFYYYKQYTNQIDNFNYLNLSLRVPLFKSKLDLSFIAKDIFNNGNKTKNEFHIKFWLLL